MSAEPETQTEPEAPLPARRDDRWPVWWPSFVGSFLAISLMVLALFTPIILLFIVVLSAWVIHHSGH
jgi:hypothetical protein